MTADYRLLTITLNYLQITSTYRMSALNHRVILHPEIKSKKNMIEQAMTFNDLPEAISHVLTKIDTLSNTIQGLREDLKKAQRQKSDLHIPMTVEQACVFLNMKRGTMYSMLQKGTIPASKKGKRYTLFQDELIKWIETGRKNEVPMTAEEHNASLKKRVGKRGAWDL